jgi:hypothetical protein
MTGSPYLAHRDGVSRIDLRARTAALLSVPHGVSIARLERIRTHRNSLIAVAVDVDGSRRILRLDLNTQGQCNREGHDTGNVLARYRGSLHDDFRRCAALYVVTC